jgi:hypothetical protein
VKLTFLIWIICIALLRPKDRGKINPKRGTSMSKPIPDKAEVTLELPDKFYSGTFERSSLFDAHMDAAGVSLLLDRRGEAAARKSVHVHLHYELFADILRELAKSVPMMLPEVADRDALRQAAEAFYRALAAPEEDVSQMTPEEQELVLQIME